MKLKHLLLIVSVFSLYVWAVFYFFPFPAFKDRVYEHGSGLISTGTPTDEFDELLSKIKADLGQENIEIKILIGPYFRYARIIGLLYDRFAPTYFILVDSEFYMKLTREEKEALVAHEAGHILFRYSTDNSLEALTETQISADVFATRYVAYEHILSWLDKLYYEYHTRRRYMENLAQGQ